MEDDPFVIFFTSGTTGRPKGVPLTHRLQRVRGGNGGWPLGPSVCMFPQFHMAGWTFTVPSWLSGDEIAFVERATAADILDAVDRRRATRLYAIPAVWRRILEAGPRQWDLSSLRVADTGTSATPPELLAAIHDTLPATMTTVVYGSTEGGTVCTLGPTEIADHPNSVGRAAAGVYVLIDENDEIWVKSPKVFGGYWRNDEATAAALVDGWYRTGERGVKDDDGFYRIIGRSKDIIRTGGESVAPTEVDQVLSTHPAVADAAVAGVPDVGLGRGGDGVRRGSPRRHDLPRGAAGALRRAALDVQAPPPAGPRQRDPADRCDRSGAAPEAGPARVDHTGRHLIAGRPRRAVAGGCPPRRRRRPTTTSSEPAAATGDDRDPAGEIKPRRRIGRTGAQAVRRGDSVGSHARRSRQRMKPAASSLASTFSRAAARLVGRCSVGHRPGAGR